MCRDMTTRAGSRLNFPMAGVPIMIADTGSIATLACIGSRIILGAPSHFIMAAGLVLGVTAGSGRRVNEYAPAWVYWRHCDGYLGWAPLPYGAVWVAGGGGNTMAFESLIATSALGHATSCSLITATSGNTIIARSCCAGSNEIASIG